MVRPRSKKTQGAQARLIDYKGRRAIGIRWKLGNRSGEVSSDTLDRDEAIGVKALLVDKLNRGIFPGKESRGPEISWARFRERYKHEHLGEMSEGSQSAWMTTANLVERFLKPKLLIEVVSKESISHFRGCLLELKDSKDKQGRWVERKLSPSSIATYLRTLGAALGWAHEEIPGIPKPPRIRYSQPRCDSTSSLDPSAAGGFPSKSRNERAARLVTSGWGPARGVFRGRIEMAHAEESLIEIVYASDYKRLVAADFPMLVKMEAAAERRLELIRSAKRACPVAPRKAIDAAAFADSASRTVQQEAPARMERQRDRRGH